MNVSSVKVCLVLFICILSGLLLRAQTNRGAIPLRTIDSIFALQNTRFTGGVNPSRPVLPAVSPTFKQSAPAAISKLSVGKNASKSTASIGVTSFIEASKTNCYDSSGRIFLHADNVYFYPRSVAKAKDGNLLICGEYYNQLTGQSSGALVKTDEWGNVMWAKTYDSTNNKNHSWVIYYSILELNDGSIVLGGSTPNSITENYDLLITKVSAIGSVIWSKCYKSRFWGNGAGSAAYFYLRQFAQDAGTGDIFFTGPHWDIGRNITRLDVNTGNVIWSKVYNPRSTFFFDNPYGLDVNGNEILSIGHYSTYDAPNTAVYRINKLNGDTIASRNFTVDDPVVGYKLGILSVEQLKKLNNGHYVISGLAYGWDSSFWDHTPLPQASVEEFDANFNFVRAFSFRTMLFSAQTSLTRVSIFPDGSGVFTMNKVLSPTGYTADAYHVQFKDGQILKQRRKRYSGELNAYSTEAVKLSDGGDMVIRLLGDSAAFTGKNELLKLHLSDTSSECIGYYDSSFFIYPFKLKEFTLGMSSVESDDFHEIPPITLTTTNVSFEKEVGCQELSHCDTISMVLRKDTVCVGQPLWFTIRKNRACGASPFFEYDKSAFSAPLQVNDSTYNILPIKPWQGYVYASFSTCVVIKDSALVTVLPVLGNVDLGADKEICPGNTVVLNAKKGYASYKWQDGSTDSIFAATAAGKYIVTAITACGDISSDTVLIVPHAPIPFDIGPAETTICPGDSVKLTATDGFATYDWQPVYNMQRRTQNIVVVYPQKDTTYKARATMESGCYSEDSIKISIKIIPSIHLGNDTSFCEKQSVVLDAGSGFESYAWNTKASTQTLTVSSAGTYIVKGSAKGCSASDTIQVISVFPLPYFSLGNDTTLCTQQVLKYNFNFNNTTYLWSTGSNANNADISQAGEYWLHATTNNGCSFGDTIKVRTIVTPVVNVGNDTTLCEGATKQLNAFYNNASYRWQDGAATAVYLVTRAGTYIVVANIENCKTADTIKIQYNPAPHFTLGNDTTICKGTELTLSPKMNSTVNYVWQDKSTTSTYTVKTDGIYSLTATNQCGTDADSIKIDFALCALNMPNAFSPNGDGSNDIFRVKYIFPVQSFNMTIYNRWGQKVFSSDDIHKGWNGLLNGMMAPNGLYIWTIAITDIDGKAQTQKGSVMLLR
ncbi:gliding motility-associated C-terminal domain-containing protein [Chitinophagaceae bacterium 26-R-25]|nr:gliding motility-associated C-terminal domain-containing protein [Chitinophagaceae bacterium 26-R-25]